jgi:hypothetical protein
MKNKSIILFSTGLWLIMSVTGSGGSGGPGKNNNKPNELTKKTPKQINKRKETKAMKYLREFEEKNKGSIEIPSQEDQDKITDKLQENAKKARAGIDHTNPQTIAKRQTSAAIARAAVDHTKPETIDKRKANLEIARYIIDNNAPNVKAARKANAARARLSAPSHIKHEEKINELFDELIQIPETPRNNDT